MALFPCSFAHLLLFYSMIVPKNYMKGSYHNSSVIGDFILVTSFANGFHPISYAVTRDGSYSCSIQHYTVTFSSARLGPFDEHGCYLSGVMFFCQLGICIHVASNTPRILTFQKKESPYINMGNHQMFFESIQQHRIYILFSLRT